MNNERIEFIDLAKGICIILVVIVHVVPDFGKDFKFVSCLRMPLYFCLSGLFYKNYGSLKNLSIRKINKILIPFVFWYLIGYAIYYIGRIITSSESNATFHIYDIFTQNEIYNLPIWFLICLFWSNMLFYVVESVSKRWYCQFALVFLIASLGWLMMLCKTFNYLYIGSSMTCLPFFYLGYMLKRTSILYSSSNKKKDFGVMSCALLMALAFAFIPDLPPRLGYYKNVVESGGPFQIYICAAAFVVALLMICKFINHIPYVSWLGRYSIIVLVTHYWMNDVIQRIFVKVSNNKLSDFSIDVISLSIVLTLMLLIIPFCIKYLPHVTSQKDVIKS